MDATLSFDELIHVISVTSSCLSSLSQINRIKDLLERNTLINVINALVFSKLYYCSSVWSSTTKKNISKLQNVQNVAARIISRSQKFDLITPVLIELKWLSVESKLIYRDCILVFKCLRGMGPDYLAKKLKKRSQIHNRERHGIRIRWTFRGPERPQAKEPSIIEQFSCGIPYPKGSLS